MRRRRGPPCFLAVSLGGGWGAWTCTSLALNQMPRPGLRRAALRELVYRFVLCSVWGALPRHTSLILGPCLVFNASGVSGMWLGSARCGGGQLLASVSKRSLRKGALVMA